MRKKSKRLLSSIAAGIMALSFITAGGCGSEKKEINVAFIPMGAEAEFWQVMKKGAEDASEEVGVKMTFSAPSNESAFDEQVELINAAINDHVDAIVISPCDYYYAPITDALTKASNSGIKIITVNSDSASDGVLCNLATDNDAAGGIASREAGKYATEGGVGKVGVIGFNEGNMVGEARVEAFLNGMSDMGGAGDPNNLPEDADADEAAAAGGISAVEILPTVYTDNSIENAQELAEKLINDNPTLSVIFTANEGTTVGACRAVEESGKDISVIGFDSSDEEVSYVNKGVLKGFIAQSPYNMGYLGIRYALKAVEGQTLPYYIDTGATLVTPDNLNDQITQLILYPDKF